MQLPPTLTTLKLRIFDSQKFLSAPWASRADAAHASGSHAQEGAQATSFAAAFPLLTTLELHTGEEENGGWEVANFGLLTPSITSLTIEQIDYVVDGDFSAKIPRQLLSLRLRESIKTTGSFWDHLPPHLTSLRARASVYEPGSDSVPELALKLPRSLTNFDGAIQRASLQLTHMPSGLIALDIMNQANPSWSVHHDMKLQFPNLRKFQVSHLTPQALRLLPPTLLHLYAQKADPSIEVDQWPSSLTDLSIASATNENFPITKLPSGLRELSYDGQFELDLSVTSLLPCTLHTLLGVNGLLGENVDFPPHLTRLSLQFCMKNPAWVEVVPTNGTAAPVLSDKATDGSNWLVNGFTPFSAPLSGKVTKCFPYDKLPDTLTSLVLYSAIPASQLKHLPRRLKTLDIHLIFIDDDFDPTSSREMEALASNFEFGRRNGVIESFDWKSLSQASMATLLPRTLSTLCISSSHVVGLDWSSIPPHLTHLSSATFFSAQFLPTLPLGRMKVLSLNLLHSSDDHFKNLPPRAQLSSCSLYLDQHATLTDKVLAYLPPTFYVKGLPRFLQEDFDEAVQCCEFHAREGNLAELCSLLENQRRS